MDLLHTPSLQNVRIFIEPHFAPCLSHIPESIEKLELIINNNEDKIINIGMNKKKLIIKNIILKV